MSYVVAIVLDPVRKASHQKLPIRRQLVAQLLATSSLISNNKNASTLFRDACPPQLGAGRLMKLSLACAETHTSVSSSSVALEIVPWRRVRTGNAHGREQTVFLDALDTMKQLRYALHSTVI